MQKVNVTLAHAGAKGHTTSIVAYCFLEAHNSPAINKHP